MSAVPKFRKRITWRRVTLDDSVIPFDDLVWTIYSLTGKYGKEDFSTKNLIRYFYENDIVIRRMICTSEYILRNQENPFNFIDVLDYIRNTLCRAKWYIADNCKYYGHLYNPPNYFDHFKEYVFQPHAGIYSSVYKIPTKGSIQLLLNTYEIYRSFADSENVRCHVRLWKATIYDFYSFATICSYQCTISNVYFVKYADFIYNDFLKPYEPLETGVLERFYNNYFKTEVLLRCTTRAFGSEHGAMIDAMIFMEYGVIMFSYSGLLSVHFTSRNGIHDEGIKFTPLCMRGKGFQGWGIDIPYQKFGEYAGLSIFKDMFGNYDLLCASMRYMSMVNSREAFTGCTVHQMFSCNAWSYMYDNRYHLYECIISLGRNRDMYFSRFKLTTLAIKSWSERCRKGFLTNGFAEFNSHFEADIELGYYPYKYYEFSSNVSGKYVVFSPLGLYFSLTLCANKYNVMRVLNANLASKPQRDIWKRDWVPTYNTEHNRIKHYTPRIDIVHPPEIVKVYKYTTLRHYTCGYDNAATQTIGYCGMHSVGKGNDDEYIDSIDEGILTYGFSLQRDCFRNSKIIVGWWEYAIPMTSAQRAPHNSVKEYRCCILRSVFNVCDCRSIVYNYGGEWLWLGPQDNDEGFPGIFDSDIVHRRVPTNYKLCVTKFENYLLRPHSENVVMTDYCTMVPFRELHRIIRQNMFEWDDECEYSMEDLVLSFVHTIHYDECASVW